MYSYQTESYRAIQALDWSHLREVWIGMGEERQLRHLQHYIRHKFGNKIPLGILVAELSKRNMQVEAREFDKRVRARVEERTIDALADKLTQSRLEGMERTARRADAVGELFDEMIQLGVKQIGRGKFDPQVFNILATQAHKWEKFRQEMEAPVIFNEDDEENENHIKQLPPERMAQAILMTMAGKKFSISQLHEAKSLDELKDVSPKAIDHE